MSKISNDTFLVTFWHEGSPVALRYGRSALFGTSVSEMRFRSNDQELSWIREQVFSIEALEKLPQLPLRLRIILEVLKRQMPTPQLLVRAERGVLVLGTIDEEDRSLRRFERLWSPAGPVLDAARNLVYLPGLRGNPERHYAISAVGPQYPGSFNDYVASIVHLWGTTADGQAQALGRQSEAPWPHLANHNAGRRRYTGRGARRSASCTDERAARAIWSI